MIQTKRTNQLFNNTLTTKKCDLTTAIIMGIDWLTNVTVELTNARLSVPVDQFPMYTVHRINLNAVNPTSNPSCLVWVATSACVPRTLYIDVFNDYRRNCCQDFRLLAC